MTKKIFNLELDVDYINGDCYLSSSVQGSMLGDGYSSDGTTVIDIAMLFIQLMNEYMPENEFKLSKTIISCNGEQNA